MARLAWCAKYRPDVARASGKLVQNRHTMPWTASVLGADFRFPWRDKSRNICPPPPVEPHLKHLARSVSITFIAFQPYVEALPAFA
jgi:hypothetical protein